MNSNKKNIWNYLTIGWMLFCILALTTVSIYYPIKKLVIAGFLLFPFILCGILIPFFLFYDRSDLSFLKLFNWIFEVRPGKSKNIHYLCLLMVPLTILFILSLILFPETFIEYGPEYGKPFSYNLAFIQFFYLVAYILYWMELKWAPYFYIFVSVFGLLVLNYGLRITVRPTVFAWDLFVIIYGFIYISKNSIAES